RRRYSKGKNDVPFLKPRNPLLIFLFAGSYECCFENRPVSTRKYLLIRLTRTCSYLNFPRISDQSKDPYDIAIRRERLGNLVGLYDLPVFSCFFLDSFFSSNYP